ncbi:MAG TPA: hypothetical protein DIS79_03190 [Bacteroidetes bacterium]|nr:hypothetical protein [Bacteroidota bacterium]HRK04196.1 zinc-dependent metalloprotease [Chlorobiota bacterium]
MRFGTPTLLLLIASAVVTASAGDTLRLRPMTVSAKAAERVQRGIWTGVGVEVSTADLRILVADRPSFVRADMPIPGVGLVEVTFRRHDVFIPGLLAVRMTSKGPRMIDPSRFVASYIGTSPDGRDISMVTTSDIMLVDITGDKSYVIEPDWCGQHTLAPAKPGSARCETNSEDVSPTIRELVRHTKPEDDVQSMDTLMMTVAIEGDYDLVRWAKMNTSSALAYIARVINVTSRIYERDFSVRLSIAATRLWEKPDDPYPSNASVFQLIDTFVSTYETTMTDVPRHLGLFITARGGRGGIAKSIGGVCESGVNYCATDIVGDIDDDPWDGEYAWDAALVSHEIAHVCGAIHTQSCYWPSGPLDSCVQSESGSCVTYEATRPRLGTIMSYCHQTRANGGGVRMEFHPENRRVLRAFLESAPCVGARPQTTAGKIVGIVTEASTDAPVVGMELRVEAFESELYMGTPAPTGVTTVVTDAEGRYQFEGIGTGLYRVVLPETHAILPFDLVSRDRQSVTLMITGPVTTLHLSVLPAQQVAFKIDNEQQIDSGVGTTIIVVGETVEDFITSTDVASQTADARTSTYRILPVGTYTAIPVAEGRVFTPQKFRFTVGGKTTSEIRFAVQKASTETTAPVLAVTLREDLTGKRTLAEGVPVALDSGKVAAPMLQSVTDAGGVVVFDTINTEGTYRLRCYTDTMLWVPGSATSRSVYFGWVWPSTFLQRERRIPYAALPYTYANQSTLSWSEISGTILASGSSATDAKLVDVTLPFPFRFNGGATSRMRICPGGYVLLGDDVFRTQWNILSTYARTTFIAAPFSTSLIGDTMTSPPGNVSWTVLGTEPHRTVVVQWKNMTYREYQWFNGQYVQRGRLTFQLHIEEATSNIRFVYGPMESVDPGVSAQVGIRGNDMIDAYGLSNVDASWDVPRLAGIPIDGTVSTMVVSPNRTVSEGKTYLWIAPDIKTSTDVEEPTTEPLAVSPLPATTHAHVRGLHNGEKVQVRDVTGRVLIVQDVYGNGAELDVTGLPSGLYTIDVLSSSGHRSTRMYILR